MAGALQLRRFQTTLFKDQSASSDLQVPADGASVQVYKQGATVRTGTTVTSGNVAVTVYGVGRLLAGDNVQKGTDSTKQMTVVSVDSDTQVTLTRAIGEDITLSAKDRLVVYSSPPTLYSDGAAVTSITNPVTLGSSGLLAFYCPETRFDYIVSGNGITTTLYIDNEGGWMRGGTAWVNVKDYSTFQAAINALTTSWNGVVHIPAGAYSPSTTPAVGAMTIGTDAKVTLEGEGPGSTYVQFTGSPNADLITITSSAFCRIAGIRFDGANTSGSGRGLVLNGATNLTVENCWFNDFPSWALDTNDATTDCVDCSFLRTKFSSSVTNGVIRLDGQHTFGFVFDSCLFFTEAGKGVDLGWSQKTTFRDCGFEGNIDGGATGYDNAYVYSAGYALAPTFDNCWFEDQVGNATPNNWFIYTNGGTHVGWSIRNCHFVRSGSTRAARVLKNANSGAMVYCVLDNPIIQVAGGTPTGADDIVTLSGDFVILIGGRITDTALTYTNPERIRVSGFATALLRLYGGYRIKAVAMNTSARDGLTDPALGDIIFNSQTDTLQVYKAAGWADV